MQQTVEMTKLLTLSGSYDQREAQNFQRELAKALEIPLQSAIFKGNILDGIFEQQTFAPGTSVEYPIDFITATNVNDFIAYVIPNIGRIPERYVEGDYVTVPTYQIGAAIDWSLKYARQARWDIVKHAMETMQMMVVRKLNDDGWHVVITAAYDRNIGVSDSTAAAGNFTKRLVSLMKTSMRRNGGGNSASTNRFKLTDLYLSPEAMEDIRNWGVDQVDEVTRREIFVGDDGSFSRIFSVNLHDLDELGVGQVYTDYFINTLGGSLAASDEELVIGLDQSVSRSFVMPVVKAWEMFDDPTLHRQLRVGVYGFLECGFASLDGRVCIFGSF